VRNRFELLFLHIKSCCYSFFLCVCVCCCCCRGGGTAKLNNIGHIHKIQRSSFSNSTNTYTSFIHIHPLTHLLTLIRKIGIRIVVILFMNVHILIIKNMFKCVITV